MPARKKASKKETPAEEPAADGALEYSSKNTVVQLKKMLTDNGLDTSGKKADLLARLDAFVASKAADGDEAAEAEEKPEEAPESPKSAPSSPAKSPEKSAAKLSPTKPSAAKSPTKPPAKADNLKESLVDLADKYEKSAGLISYDEANLLWKSACDGPGVTETEFKTLRSILEEKKFSRKARDYLDALVTKQSSGTSFYKQINNVKYDRSCLDLADHLVKDGKISVGDARQIWDDVSDGPGVTETEQLTIRYVMDNYTLTKGAENYFAAQLEKIAKVQEKVEAEAPVAEPEADKAEGAMDTKKDDEPTENPTSAASPEKPAEKAPAPVAAPPAATAAKNNKRKLDSPSGTSAAKMQKVSQPRPGNNQPLIKPGLINHPGMMRMQPRPHNPLQHMNPHMHMRPHMPMQLSPHMPMQMRPQGLLQQQQSPRGPGLLPQQQQQMRQAQQGRPQNAGTGYYQQHSQAFNNMRPQVHKVVRPPAVQSHWGAVMSAPPVQQRPQSGFLPHQRPPQFQVRPTRGGGGGGRVGAVGRGGGRPVGRDGLPVWR